MVEAVRKAHAVVKSVFDATPDPQVQAASWVSDGASAVEHWEPQGVALGKHKSPHGLLAQHLCRLSRLGANIADAHSCFVFLPVWMLDPSARLKGSDDLILGGFHSLSRQVITDCRLSQNTGLIGWVAKHGRSIHVSPFERDSRTLGMYSHDQGLKSFIAVPFNLAHDDLPGAEAGLYGVVACDSCKSYAFSKAQVKILEDFASEVGQTALLHLNQSVGRTHQQSWQLFLQMTERLSEELGLSSLEILRLRLPSSEFFEHAVGVKGMCEFSDQFLRLIRQSLPEATPVLTLPGGDILLVVDRIMGGSYGNRLRALFQSATQPLGITEELEIRHCPIKASRFRKEALEALIAATASNETPSPIRKGIRYERC